jgi:hypothetical protein
MTLTAETAEAKFPRELVLRIFRKIGNALYAAPAKKCSGRWLVRDPLKMTRIGRDLETTSRKYTCKNRFI